VHKEIIDIKEKKLKLAFTTSDTKKIIEKTIKNYIEKNAAKKAREFSLTTMKNEINPSLNKFF
jgi:hypothetical protein